MNDLDQIIALAWTVLWALVIPYVGLPYAMVVAGRWCLRGTENTRYAQTWLIRGKSAAAIDADLPHMETRP